MGLLWIWILVTTISTGYGYTEVIRLGGLFHTGEELEEASFKAAIEFVNIQRLLHRSRMEDYPVKVPKFDSLQVSSVFCDLLTTGIAGILGPHSAFTTPHVQSMCDVKGIPHVETRWNIRQKRNGPSINVHPHPTAFAKAVMDLVKAYDWKSFTILYQKEDALVGISPLLKHESSHQYDITVRQLDKGNDYRDVLRKIRNSPSSNIVLDCSISILEEVLRQAQQVGIMVAEYSLIVTNLDLHTVDLEAFQYGGTNITGFRIVDPEEPKVVSAVKRWVESESRNGRVLEITPETVPLQAALIHDAVLLYTKALNAFKDITVKPLSCETEDMWLEGDSLMGFMVMSTVKGLTGLVEFDHQGFRTNFNLDLVELTGDGLNKIGTWNSTGLNLTRSMPEQGVSVSDETVANKTFIVLIAITAPYGMLTENSERLTGNARYEGFGIDVIHELSLMLGFNYTFVVQQDGKYGSLNKVTKEWNGMLKEIMDWRADLAITDLTITHDREGAVDFTMPFMNLGISILYKKPQKQPPSLFSFLSPFSNEVWMYMLGAYIGVSVLLFVMARISPYEWTNPYPCIEEPDELENQFSLKNSLWFTIGSLMQQGSEIAPIAVSTRMVAGIWWFFTLIMVSSYTANLAAFLTVESTMQPFRNVEELANQKAIKYGAKKDGSTASFFTESSHPIYGKMGEFMLKNPDVFPRSNDEALVKVMNEEYAYFMESTSIEYEVERNCDITQVGGMLDNKGYGIAMRKNSSYRNALSTGVLRLQETGKLSQMKRKWWKEKRGGGACANVASADASELDLENVGGVFVVLVAGVFLACFITVCEMLWNVGSISRKEKVAFKEELMEELKFVARCHGSTKPVRKRNIDGEPEEGIEVPPMGTNYGWFVSDEPKSALT